MKTDAFANLWDPPEKWAIIKDCGEWPCTAPLNLLYRFENSQFIGTKPSFASDSFQIISNNTGFSPHVEGCTPMKKWNAYVCENEDLGVLLFES